MNRVSQLIILLYDKAITIFFIVYLVLVSSFVPDFLA